MSETATVHNLLFPGQASVLRRLAPDEVAVVSNSKNGIEVIEPGTEIDQLGIWLRRYRRAYVIKTSAFHKEWEQNALSAEPPYDFDLKVKVSARVSDPVAFVKFYGDKGSVFSPFEDHLKAEIEQLAQNYYPSKIRSLKDRLKLAADRTKTGEWYVDSVQVLTCDIVVNQGPVTRNALQAAHLQHLWDERGPTYLALAGHQKEIESVISLQRTLEKEHFERVEKTLDLADRVYPDDAELKELELKEAGFDRTLREGLAPPRQVSTVSPKKKISEKLLPDDYGPQGLIEDQSRAIVKQDSERASEDDVRETSKPSRDGSRENGESEA